MGTDDTNPPVRRGRWMQVVLILSLALNLLVVGAVAGRMLGHVKERRDGPREASVLNYGPYSKALSRADRAALRQALSKQKDNLHSNRTEVRKGFRDVLAALRAQPYDAAATEALLNAQQQRVGDQIRLVRQALLDRIATMSDAERAAFADRLDEVLKHGPRGSRR